MANLGITLETELITIRKGLRIVLRHEIVDGVHSYPWSVIEEIVDASPIDGDIWHYDTTLAYGVDDTRDEAIERAMREGVTR